MESYNKKDIQELSNAELKLEMVELEGKYEAIKHKIFEMINEMKKLDSNFTKVKQEYNNRSKGIFNGYSY